MESEFEERSSGDVLLTQVSRKYLNEIAKWAKFLSLLGMILLGISFVLLLGAGIVILGTNKLMEGDSLYQPGVFKWTYAFVYLVVMLLYYIPLYYLYKFAVNTKAALQANNTDALTTAFNFLKKHYKFKGVLVVVCLAFYAAGIIVFIVSAIAAM